MEYQNEGITIAGKKTIREWNECLKKLDGASTVQDWEYAFSFFNDRITTRYLNPIKKILDMSLSTGEGFAVVNLQCSLIETIESFYNGWIHNHPYYLLNGLKAKCPWDERTNLLNKHIFISFFKYRITLADQNIEGGDFFHNIRCGLLHETQTKNGWVIKSRNPSTNVFFIKNKNEKIIYRNNFQTAIEETIYNYKRAIVDGESFGSIQVSELRENFKSKFSHICQISSL